MLRKGESNSKEDRKNDSYRNNKNDSEEIISIERITRETTVSIYANFCKAKSSINTEIPMLTHLLTAFAYHSNVGLKLNAKGDCEHHIVEDCGIVLGAIYRKYIDRQIKYGKSISRYGYFILPMDETLICCSLDIDGRGYFESDIRFNFCSIETLQSDSINEFFKAFSRNLKASIHFIKFRGNNDHHIVEALFKSLGKSLSQALMIVPNINESMSTKGVEQWIINK